MWDSLFNCDISNQTNHGSKGKVLTNINGQFLCWIYLVQLERRNRIQFTRTNKTFKPGVHKRKWDAESRSGAFFGSKKRAAQRNLGIEIFLFLVAPLSENGKLILKSLLCHTFSVNKKLNFSWNLNVNLKMSIYWMSLHIDFSFVDCFCTFCSRKFEVLCAFWVPVFFIPCRQNTIKNQIYSQKCNSNGTTVHVKPAI